MTSPKASRMPGAKLLLAASVLTLALAGCKHGEPGTRVAGWTLVDPAQRHPILVSQKPNKMTLHVARGSYGLNPQQRARVISYAGRYKARDAGNSRLVIAAPSGSPNEVAAMHAVQEIRDILSEEGFGESAISVEAYHSESDPAPPIRVSYLRYVAEAPECGQWPTNLAHEPQNLPYPNLGCATQRNFANQVANPADLLGPRTMTARSSERRDKVWNKFVRGDVTNAKKSNDERLKVKGKK